MPVGGGSRLRGLPAAPGSGLPTEVRSEDDLAVGQRLEAGVAAVGATGASSPTSKPAGSVSVSLPASPLTMSLPLPPSRSSTPAPPLRRSLPLPPLIRSAPLLPVEPVGAVASHFRSPAPAPASTVSSPDPASMLSAAPPPLRMSLPAAPSRRSRPRAPMSVSAPASPSRLSAPSCPLARRFLHRRRTRPGRHPDMRCHSSMPNTTSSPASATNTSGPFVPNSTSFPFVPTCVAGSPLHVGAARRAVPVGQSAGQPPSGGLTPLIFDHFSSVACLLDLPGSCPSGQISATQMLSTAKDCRDLQPARRTFAIGMSVEECSTSNA